jgi:tetratricopeptide (TPR) repeat protein
MLILCEEKRRIMNYKLLVIYISVLLPALAGAQENVTINRKTFTTSKAGLKEAWPHVKKGDSYYMNKGVWYSMALEEYRKAFTYNPANPELNYKMGVSALWSDKKEEASGFFLKALESKPGVADDIRLLTGRSLMFVGKYSAAIDTLNSYLNSSLWKSKKNSVLAKKYAEECASALIVSKDTLEAEIKNIGANINSSADDYSVVLTEGGAKMLFASRRATSANSKNYYQDTKFDENIYTSDWLNGAWTAAVIFDKNIFTKYCETPLYMNSSGTRLYIYAGYKGGGDIMVSVLKKGDWKLPVNEEFGINTSSNETSFTISSTGKEIAFVSNRGKKGLGGKDIYIMKEKNSRKWYKPINIGPALNTEYDEESVRFSLKGDTLWFSSRGHNTTGGFDIFYSTRNQDGTWNKAVNAGYPINSAWDDLFFNPPMNGNGQFFMVSNRSGGFGGFDIYTGRLLPKKPKPEVIMDTASVKIIIPDSTLIKSRLKKDSANLNIINVIPDTIIKRDTLDNKELQLAVADDLEETLLVEVVLTRVGWSEAVREPVAVAPQRRWTFQRRFQAINTQTMP